MTDLRSELVWLVEDYINLSDVVENDRGWPGSYEKNKAAQERARAVLAMSDWQPIETADTVGALLGYDPNQHPFARVTAIIHLGGNWQAASAVYGDKTFSPTHWLPLPDPPKD